ncbi:TPA: restriction endonuclease subunit S [Escherichia coli]|nr:restriction endonuclease subunit S [Escherichia coli]
MGSNGFKLPLGWNCKKLVDCTKEGNISYGIVQPGQHQEDGIGIIRVNNIQNGNIYIDDVLKVSHEIESKFAKTRLEGGEVLLTLVGSTGISAITTKALQGWNVARAVAVIKPCDEISAEWIHICLQSPFTKYFLDSRANTTVQKTLNLKDVKEIPLPIPPHEERVSLEKIYFNFENRINLNIKINKILEEMSQNLFKSWFVDFDPVVDNALDAGNPIPEALQSRAELRQKVRNSADFKPLPAEIRSLFPSEFEETELGWVPKGWQIKSLDHIANFQNGLALQKFRPKNMEDDYLPVLKIADLRAGQITNDERARTDISDSCKVYDGDMIFSWSGTLMIDIWTGGNAALNQHLYKVTSKKYPQSFYFMWTIQHLSRFQHIAEAKAVTMGHIKKGDLSNSFCLIPTSSLITKYDNIVGGYLAKIKNQRLLNNQMTALRDTLLPKLISGELSLDDIPDLTTDTEAA